MSHRSATTSLIGPSTHHASTGALSSDNRPTPGPVDAGVAVAGSAGSATGNAGDAKNSATSSDDFQKLLTHVGTSAQGKGHGPSSPDAKKSADKKHDHKSDAKGKSDGAPTALARPQLPTQAAVGPVPTSTGTPHKTSTSQTAGGQVSRESSAAVGSIQHAGTPSASAATHKAPTDPVTGAVHGNTPGTSSSNPADRARIKPMDPKTIAASPNAAKSSPQDGAVAVASKSATQGPTAGVHTGTGGNGPQNLAALADQKLSARAGNALDSRNAPTHSVRGAEQLPAQIPVTVNPAPATHASLNHPIGSQQWNDELGTQLIWMAHHNVEAATLHVSPAGLGPIEARIAMQGGTASVWFGAAHPATRAALEQALPRLRAMFATQGLSLMDSGVFREAPRRRPSPSIPRIGAVSSVQPLTQPAAASQSTATQLGIVDLYA